MSGGTMISIPKNYAREETKVVFDEKLDRYTLVALTDSEENNIILGDLYLTPAIVNYTVALVKEQYNDIEKALDYLLRKKIGN